MPGPHDRRPADWLDRQLRSRGVTAPRVLAAMARVDRRRFVPPPEREQAVADAALPIGCAQTISQPYMVGAMTQELALAGPERVLEIGTGSGYQAAILAVLAAEVYTIERHPTLSLRARGVLDGMGLTNLRYKVGDGTLGWPEAAPFDRILVTAAAPAVPPPLFKQLAEGGLLIAPVGGEEGQELHVIRKESGRPVVRTMIPCRFVKLIGEEGWAEGGE